MSSKTRGPTKDVPIQLKPEHTLRIACDRIAHSRRGGEGVRARTAFQRATGAPGAAAALGWRVTAAVGRYDSCDSGTRLQTNENALAASQESCASSLYRLNQYRDDINRRARRARRVFNVY